MTAYVIGMLSRAHALSALVSVLTGIASLISIVVFVASFSSEDKDAALTNSQAKLALLIFVPLFLLSCLGAVLLPPAP